MISEQIFDNGKATRNHKHKFKIKSQAERHNKTL